MSRLKRDEPHRGDRSGGGDPLADGLEAEIAQTRKDLHDAVDALADKIELKARMRSRMTGAADGELENDLERTRQDVHDTVEALVEKIDCKANIRYAVVAPDPIPPRGVRPTTPKPMLASSRRALQKVADPGLAPRRRSTPRID